MPLSKRSTRVFHRTLYAGQLESVVVLKRDDDQRAAVVRSIQLYQCRWSQITKGGQPLDHDVATQHFRTLHIPRTEMDRTGINYFNQLDRFIDEQGERWQPETPHGNQTGKLWRNHTCIDCRRIGPNT